jgi:DNA primase
VPAATHDLPARSAPAPQASVHADARAALPPQRNWERLTLDEQVVMAMACAVYQRCLWRNPRALAYLRARGLPYGAIKECGLGYADGHSLEEYLRRRGGLRVAQDLGLLRRAGAGGAAASREFLADRIVVPEFRGGQCIWFIGRTVGPLPGAGDRPGRAGCRPYADRRPKYLALPGDRPLLGYERAAGRREVVLCEGVLDYVTAVAWKLAAFSPCGTHVPAERLAFLSRTDRVYGVFDADEAGWEASARLAALLGERWRPLALPDGTDLNDLATRPGGAGTFFRLLAAAREAATTPSAAPPPPTNLSGPPPVLTV